MVLFLLLHLGTGELSNGTVNPSFMTLLGGADVPRYVAPFRRLVTPLSYVTQQQQVSFH